MAQYDFSFPELEEPKQTGPSRKAAEGVGTAVRTGIGMAAHPTAAAGVRLASGLATSVGPKVAAGMGATGVGLIPAAVTALASGAIGGGGEILAQLLETGASKPINWKRVGVESGISAVPLAREAKKAWGAAKGGLLAAAGVVGRKATDEDPNTSAWDPKQYGMWDAAQVGMGAGIGSLFAKGTAKPSVAPIRQTPESILRSGKYKPEHVDAEVLRLESLGKTKEAAELRRLAAQTGTATADTYKGTVSNQNRETTAGRTGQRFQEHNVDRARRESERLAKEANTAREAQEALRLRDEALASGATPKTTVGETATAKTSTGTVRANTRYVAEEAEEEGAEALGGGKAPTGGPKGPTTPPATPSAAPQASSPRGLIPVAEMLQNPATKMRIEAKMAAGASLDDAAKQVFAEGSTAPPAPFNPPRIAEPTPQPPTTPVQPVSAAPIAPAQAIPEVAPQAPTALPSAAPKTGSGVPLQTPLAFKVAEAQMTPDGAPVTTPFARFFRNPEQAHRAQEYATKLTDEQMDTFQPILSQYEAAGKKTPQARGLGELLSRMRDDMGLPKMARNIKAPVATPKPPASPIRQEADAMTEQVLDRAQNAKRGTPADVPNDPVAREVEQVRQGDYTPSGTAPQAILDKIEEFKMRREAAINAATSVDDAQRIGAQFDAEANALQLELSLAERAVEKASRGGGGGTTLGFGLGGAQDIMAAIRRNPEFATRLASTGIGAGIGAGVSPEDRASGAMLGGTAGFLGAPALGKLLQASDGGQGLSPMDRLVNWQRFSLLSHPHNLAVNFAAPTGGGTLGSIEKILAGKLGGDQDAVDMGKRGLGAIWSAEHLKQVPQSYKNAIQRLGESSERGDAVGGQGNMWDNMAQFPATIMTTGDEGVRNQLMNSANWSEDAARAVTATSEPRYDLSKKLVDIARGGGPIGRLALPFSRTAANVIESSLERTPVGLLMGMTKSAEDPEIQATVAEIVARQGLGAGVGAVSYLLGRELDPEFVKQNKILMTITNLTGQYGAIAGSAFLAGQAAQAGKTTGEQVTKAGTSFLQQAPLPTTETGVELWNSAGNLIDRQPPKPSGNNLLERWIPDPFLPRFIKGSTGIDLPGTQYDFNFGD